MDETLAPEAPTQEDPPIKRLWSSLRKQEGFTRTFDEFSADMQDPDNVAALHASLSKKNKAFTVPLDEFEADMGVKKKDQSKPSSAPTGEPASATAAPLQPGLASAGAASGDVPFADVTPPAIPGLQPDLLPDALGPNAEQVFAPDFTGPLPDGTYQKRDDAGTGAEGAAYLSAASKAGALNMPAASPASEDGFFSTLGKQLTNLPATLENTGGNVVDYLGDVGEMQTQGLASLAGHPEYGISQPLTDDKITDQAGQALRTDAQQRTTQVSELARQSVLDHPTNPAAWGNLLGQGVNSVAAISAASLVGGPTAGIVVGGGLGVSATKDAARDAGISDKEAAMTATLLAPIQGVLEEMGVGFITKNKAVTGLLTKTIVGRALAETGGQLSEAALIKSASALMPGVVKRALSAGTGEAVTEFLQGEAEGITKLAADRLRGNADAPAGGGRYGVSPFDALLKNPAEQAVGGFVAGGAIGSAFHGQHQTPVAPVVEELATNVASKMAGEAADQASGPEATTVRTIPLGESGRVPGEQVYVELRPDGSINQIHNGKDRLTGAGAEAFVAERLPAALAAEQPAPSAPATDPSIVDVTGQPEALPAEAAPANSIENPAQNAAEAVLPTNDPQIPTETAPVEFTPAEPLPAEPHPDHVTPLTPKQQASNDALDALDRYNALGARAKKGKEGSQARAEISRAADKAGLSLTIGADFSAKLTREGKRVTRSNEYTGTTPANNHVPLAERPAEARPFMERVVEAADGFPNVVQGLGVEMRGKPLNAQELSGAVADIKAGKNTMRAQLVLDALENAHRRGYVEKSEGTGMNTRKYSVPVDEYATSNTPDIKHEVALSDPELDKLLADEPAAKQAIADYTKPDGTVNFEQIVKDGANGLRFLFDIDEPTANKLIALANERAQQQAQDDSSGAQPGNSEHLPEIEAVRAGDGAAQAGADAGSQPQGSPSFDGPGAGSEGAAPAEVAPSLAEQNIAAKQEFADALAGFRAARKKGSNTVQSSVLGIPAFSAEESAYIKQMIGAAVKLGAVKTKQVVARLRSMGLADDEATDEQLKPLIQQHLQEAGLKTPKPPKRKTVADNPADATGERAHAKRYTEETQRQLTDDERNYVPSAAKIAANESPADYIKRVGPDMAYEAAIGEKTQDHLLHDNLIRGVAEHYTAERNAATKAGDTNTADAAQERIMRLVGALAKSGTEQAQGLAARVGAGGTIADLLAAKDPAATGQATVNEAFGSIASRNAEAQKRNEKDADGIVSEAKPKRQRKMAEVLETPTVKTAVEKAANSKPPTDEPTAYGATNKHFTKKGLTELRARLKNMAFSAPLPPDLVYLAGYHLEASTRKFAEWSRKMVQEVGVRVRPHLADLYDQAKAELLKKDPQITGFSTSQEVAALVAEQAAPRAVSAGLKELGKRITAVAKQHATDVDTDRRTLTEKFIQDAGLSGPVAKEMADAIEKEWSKRVQKGAWQSIGRRFQPKRTRARGEALDRLVNDLNAAVALPETTMRSPVAQLLEQRIGNNVPVSATEAEHIEALKDAYVAAAQKTTRTIGGKPVATQNTREVAAAATKLLQAIGRLKNVDQQEWGRDTGAMFFASLLSSPNTHLANAYLNTLSTAHEVGAVSTLHTWADTGSLRLAGRVLGALGSGYKRGAADAHGVLTTGIDPKSKVGAVLNDSAYETDPLEEHSVVRRRLVEGLNKIGIGKGWAVPEKSAARVVRRALGASDTFFQGGLAEARAKEIAIKLAVRAVERRQASGEAMTSKEVRQYVADEADRILFNTPQALTDIKAIVDSEGLGQPKTAQQWAARNARIGDLLDQARASEHPELVSDSKEFAARHAGNSEYEGHLGRLAYGIADTFKDIPVVGKIIVPFARVTSNFQNRYAEWTGLGFYRAFTGGAGKPFLGRFGALDKRFVRDFTPEEREKAFLRSTLGAVVGMSAIGLSRAGYIAITGLSSGNKDDDRQHPAQSIILLKGPLAGKSWTFKGTNEEIGLTAIGQTMAWARTKQLRDDDPTVLEKMRAAALLTAAATLNTGPTNGAGDFLGAVSRAPANPDAWFKAVSRLSMTGTKAFAQPAGLTYAFNLFNQATDAHLPEKRSNEVWQSFQLQVFGDVPYWHGGGEDALDVFGDPMEYTINRFWGSRPMASTPHKDEIKQLLVKWDIMPPEIHLDDRRLRLYDPKTGDRVSPLSNKEFKQFAQVRGQHFLSYLLANNERLLRQIKQAETPKQAVKARNAALSDATDDALKAIREQRAHEQTPAVFKLSKLAQAQKEAKQAKAALDATGD